MPVVVALDFETADKYPDSACALGMSRIENGQVVADWYSLSVRPVHRSILPRFTASPGIC